MSENSTAAVIARFLKARAVQRVFGLCGGHIMPIWMRVDEEGIDIIDVRDERAARDEGLAAEGILEAEQIRVQVDQRGAEHAARRQER